MIESHLFEGNQSSDLPKEDMKYGVSVTDACIDFPTTENIMHKMANSLSTALIARQKN